MLRLIVWFVNALWRIGWAAKFSNGYGKSGCGGWWSDARAPSGAKARRSAKIPGLTRLVYAIQRVAEGGSARGTIGQTAALTFVADWRLDGSHSPPNPDFLDLKVQEERRIRIYIYSFLFFFIFLKKKTTKWSESGFSGFGERLAVEMPQNAGVAREDLCDARM